LDQVEQGNALAGVPAGDPDDEAQIRLDQQPCGRSVSRLLPPEEGLLLLRCEQRYPADAPDIERERVLSRLGVHDEPSFQDAHSACTVAMSVTASMIVCAFFFASSAAIETQTAK